MTNEKIAITFEVFRDDEISDASMNGKFMKRSLFSAFVIRHSSFEIQIDG